MHSNDSSIYKKLFLFAHQDDEFGVFPVIEKSIADNECVICIYATDGSVNASPELRNQESISVLTKLGVTQSNVIFAGQLLNIKDNQLHNNIDLFIDWLLCFLSNITNINDIYVPAWEGGHPDHDVLNAITSFVSKRLTPNINLYQFALYNGKGLIYPFFKVLTPLNKSPTDITYTINLSQKIKFLYYCTLYPSQWRSWLGLFPMVFIFYLFKSKIIIQRVSDHDYTNPPYINPIYYENSNKSTWHIIKLSIRSSRIISK